MTRDDEFIKANEAANEILKELEKIKSASDLVEQASKDTHSMSVSSSLIVENMKQLMSVVEDTFDKLSRIDHESNHQELVEKIEMIFTQQKQGQRNALITSIAIISLLILGFGFVAVVLLK
jgi:hypothetical protein